MSATTKTPETMKLLFTSPYLILVFLIVPAVTVASYLLHLPNPKSLLILNNAGLLLILALRCGWYLKRLGSAPRYGADRGRPARSSERKLAAARQREKLASAGYLFDAGGRYGERPDLGYLGTAILYGGLTMILLVGTLDNLREYSGAVVTGPGTAVPMMQAQTFQKGLLVSLEKMPLVQVRRQFKPDGQYPGGATDIALLSHDGKLLASGITAPGKPLYYGGVVYEMSRFMFDTTIAVSQGGAPAVGGDIRLKPLPVKQGDYGYYGKVPNNLAAGIHGDAWYNPAQQSLKLILTLNGKQIFGDYLQTLTRTSVTNGIYNVNFLRLGQWSDIRLVTTRHLFLMKLGAVVALIGLLMRLLIRPKRVWLEETDEGCRVWTRGQEPLKILETAEE